MNDALVMKNDDILLIADMAGDITTGGAYGLYWHDTRYLSRLQLTLNGATPRYLSTTQPYGFLAHIYLANPELSFTEGAALRGPTVALRRSLCIAGGLLQKIELINFNRLPITVEITLAFSADFMDMFEIRGAIRDLRGEYLPTLVSNNGLTFRYHGRDGLLRETRISFSVIPDHISQDTASFRFALAPGQSKGLEISIRPYVPGQSIDNTPWKDFSTAQAALCRSYAQWLETSTTIEIEHPILNRLVQQSQSDLYLLLDHFPTGPYPVAGIPWFAVPFGRDGIITALETLMFNPDIAVGVLRYLASHQGQAINEQRDEEPGKILHEMRYGEMALAGEIPHTPYYGSIDATPLFILLFAQTMDWLDDDELYAEILPAVKRALEWTDRYGDQDGDGYVEYLPRAPQGLRNQGWKDGPDAVQYPDGTWVILPAALVEVQGYVYDAKVRLARLFRRKGETKWADHLEAEAASLKMQFNKDFWLPSPTNQGEAGSYLAQALDGNKQLIISVTSNMGHALWSGIIEEDKAALVAQRLLAEDMFSGWGIRTLASSSPNYNPMSYHNGSVWPHDNAIIVAGLYRYGFKEEAVKVAEAILEMGMNSPDLRLPELFCGFTRDEAKQPVAYPAACRPQAWAACSVFLLLQTLLGLQVTDGRLTLSPYLPRWIGTVRLRNMRVGKARFRVEARGDKAKVSVEKGH